MLNNNGNVPSLPTPDEQAVVVASFESHKKQLQDICHTRLHELMPSRSRALLTKAGYDPSEVEDLHERGNFAVYF